MTGYLDCRRRVPAGHDGNALDMYGNTRQYPYAIGYTGTDVTHPLSWIIIPHDPPRKPRKPHTPKK